MTNTTAAKTWSAQQLAIFTWFSTMVGLKHLVVRARAGTGKTTTIVEAVTHAPEWVQDIIICAFNKRIAEELTKKNKDGRVTASTLHSLGFRAILKAWRGTRLDEYRGQRIAEEVCQQTGAPDSIVDMVRKLAALGKNMLPLADANNRLDVEALEEIGYEFECVPDDEEWANSGWTASRVAKLAAIAMDRAGRKDGTVDFDDMVYVAVRARLARPSFDLVVVDEAQDMNAAQLLLAQRLCRPKGSIVIVGDDRQAIYGFRGADSGAIDRMKAELNADELGLTVTYRCAQLIVAEAQKLVPDYQAAPSAPEGLIETIMLSQVEATAQSGDAILSRKNAPLAGICLRLLRQGKRARIEGKDIGRGLVTLVRKLAGKGRKVPTIEMFLDRLSKWEEREKAKAKARGKNVEDHVLVIEDKAETIAALAEGLTSIQELVGRIEALFDDSKPGALPAIVCSSVHKAKGLEWKKVFVLQYTLYPGKKVDREEENIHYVAVTRPIDTLVWVLKD